MEGVARWKMNGFEVDDMVVEIGLPTKWIVWYMDRYSYSLKLCPGYGEDTCSTRRTIDKSDGNARFVKVGRWNGKLEEFDPIDN